MNTLNTLNIPKFEQGTSGIASGNTIAQLLTLHGYTVLPYNTRTHGMEVINTEKLFPSDLEVILSDGQYDTWIPEIMTNRTVDGNL